MGDTCTICAHRERVAIDANLRAGQFSLDQLAATFHVSRSSLHRHNRAHLRWHSPAARERMRPRRRWKKWAILGGVGALLGAWGLAALRRRP